MKFPRYVENLIANLRSLPENAGRSTDRPALKMDTLVESFIQEYKIGELRLEENLITHWRNVMGGTHADRCRPQRVDKENRLIIAVSNPILRQELTFRKNEILERIRKIDGCEKITGIIFKAG
jgi:hypothetical protein